MIFGKKRAAPEPEVVNLAKTISIQFDETIRLQRETNLILRDVFKSNKEFVEVIRHFFAIEKALHTEQAKLRLEAEDAIKPGKHDDLY